MTLKDRVIESLGLVSKRELESAVHQAYISGYNDGNDEPPSGTLVSYGYRQASTGGRRDGKLSWDELCNVAWDMYNTNPVADRGLELKRDHILGRGVDIQTDNEDLEEVITNFRKFNKFDVHLREYVLQLFLFGVQCLPVSIRQSDGRVRLNYIDPQQIQDVLAHPQNPTEQWAVIVKPIEGLPAWAGGNIPRRVYRIIREDSGYIDGNKVISPNEPDRLVTAEQARLEPWEGAMLASFGLSAYTGSCFYFHINAVSNQTFGVSDLQRTIYWLQQLDEALLAVADREMLSGYWYNDITMTGATADQVKARAAELKRRPPARGGINVHNDREVHDIKQPQSDSGSTEVTDSLFDYAWGGLGFPRHWYVQGDATNRATATEQASPVQKTLQSDQDAVKEIVETIISFVRDQAIIAGFPVGDDETFTVVMPEIASRNLEGLGKALLLLTNIIEKGIAAGFISEETARDIWAKFLVELGFEINPQEEAEKVKAERAEKDKVQKQKQLDLQKMGLANHPDPDISNAPTVTAAESIAVEKVRLGQAIDGSASIQDEINEAVRIAQASWKLEHNGKH